MRYPQKSGKRRKGSATVAPLSMSLKDKLRMWAWIAGFLLFFIGGFHFYTTQQQRTSLDELLEHWRLDYHLNDDQTRRIRAMEEAFHGSGDPFSRPAHTRDETREHHRSMASVMNPEDGERFFQEQEGSPLLTN